MITEKVTYERLHRVLERLGYVADAPRANRVVYRHPNSAINVILPRVSRRATLKPIDLLSVQNALANGGVVAKEDFSSLFQTTPVELWHWIIDAEAEFHNEHGRPPRLLRLPIAQAYDLAKLRRKELGDLAAQVMHKGVRVFEEQGLLGIPVKLVDDGDEFVFE